MNLEGNKNLMLSLNLEIVHLGLLRAGKVRLKQVECYCFYLSVTENFEYTDHCIDRFVIKLV